MKVKTHTVELLHATPDPERLIERCGRICWQSEERITDDSYIKFIRTLKGRQHDSVLEHASAGFLLGTDRGISHELVRHRLASYSQLSTRYCAVHDLHVVKPVQIDETQIHPWLMGVKAAGESYFAMLKSGAKPEIARAVLPNSLWTQVAMTCNFREWRHFLHLRLAPSAHPDMRFLAGLIRDELKQVAPVVFEDF